ncbi:MAG: NAD(+)/NADH kinase [Candidatus Competibacteraceae bacterium]|nr:NAD(+)/NADH kinase [Candidatus Competibacteraceae bacterium]
MQQTTQSSNFLSQGGKSPLIGIVANPVSARDIRRLIANANSLQVADRANIVLRILAALAATGVGQVLMMPDKGGIRAYLQRSLAREQSLASQSWPQVDFVEMPVEGSVRDTWRAVEAMVAAAVDAIIVLGGDGTHRAVVSRCGAIPVAGLSTGTNNAFPDLREPTITGLAAGLLASGKLSFEQACSANKLLRVEVERSNGEQLQDLALVDIVLTTERYVGARALWKTDGFRELFVTFAEPHAIGMSAIAGLLAPMARSESQGVWVQLGSPGDCTRQLHAPIAPGLVLPVGVRDWRTIDAGERIALPPQGGSLALDGEREIELSPTDRVHVSLVKDAFYTVDVSAAMQQAAVRQLLLHA